MLRPYSLPLVASFTVVLLLAACSGSSDDSADTTLAPTTIEQATTTTSASTTTAATTTTVAAAAEGCEVLHESGEYEGLNVVGELEQPYWVIVPEAYSAVVPAPVYLHLASGSGDHDSFLAGWRPYLDDLDGLMVMANTAAARLGEPGGLAALLGEVSGDYCVDSQRVHVMGTSWSGGMAERFVCQESEMIASFVSAMTDWVPTSGCNPTRAVPLLTFTGNVDRSHIDRLVARWTEINGCNPEPFNEDLGSGVSRRTYEGCAADVLFYDITTMGHAWPLHEAKGPGADLIAEYDEVDYLDEALTFFANHPLP